MPDELRSPLEKVLVAQALSIQTPGGAGIRELLALAQLSGRKALRWPEFNKLALMTWLSALGSQSTQAEPSQVSPTPGCHPRGL